MLRRGRQALVQAEGSGQEQSRTWVVLDEVATTVMGHSRVVVRHRQCLVRVVEVRVARLAAAAVAEQKLREGCNRNGLWITLLQSHQKSVLHSWKDVCLNWSHCWHVPRPKMWQ